MNPYITHSRYWWESETSTRKPMSIKEDKVIKENKEDCGMKSVVLKELIEKWNAECRNDEAQDGSEEAKVDNARNDGYKKGIARCADQLGVLVELLGD